MPWTYEMTDEMLAIIEALYESVDHDVDACCEKCPYADICHRDGSDLFYQCNVWEDSQGEDL